MRSLLFLLLLSLGAWAQPDDLPPPPPLLPESRTQPGKATPFNPDQTREAIPAPPPLLEVPAEWTPEGPFTLEQAIGLALLRQPDMLSARGQVRQANGVTTQLRSQLMPKIGGSGIYSHRSATTPSALARPAILTTDTFDTNLGINQLIFDFGNTRERVHQADLLRQAADWGVLAAQNDLALRVKERFYAVLQNQRLLTSAQSDLSNRQEQLRLARALYKAGNKSPGDVVRAQTAVSNSVFNLNTARRNLELAQQDLAQSLGLPSLTPLNVTEQNEPDLPTREVRPLLDKAMELRPDLLAAQRTVEGRKSGLNAAHTTNYPSLSTFAGVAYQGTTTGVQYPSVLMQLQVNFNVYDGGLRSGTIEQAEGVLDSANADLLRTQLAVQREVTGVLAQLVSAERNVQAASLAVDAASEGIRIAFGRYRAALGTVTDVFDAQNQLLSANNNLANAQADLNLSRARLRHALASPFGEGY